MKAVIFDLDGTLFDRDTSIRRVVESQYADFSWALTDVSVDHFIDRFANLDNHGLVDKNEVYCRLAEQFGFQNAMAEVMLDDFWRRYHRYCVPYPWLYETLEELRERGLKLGLVTNGKDRIQNGTIDALGVRGHFDTIQISESVGIRKPDARIFHLAVDALGISPHEAVYVGDNPVADVAGALSAGLKAIWRRQPYWDAPKEDVPVIDELCDLKQVIRDA